jgi:hypothetical protein
MKHLRLTEEQLRDLERRGHVKTHTIAGPGEARGSDQPKRGGRKSKYGNVKAEADGQLFASKQERGRWMDLRLEEKAGAIKDLKRQVVYPIEVNGLRVCDYIADFQYERDGRMVTEDAKGYRTDIFKLKSKLMRAVHGIEVLET